MNKDKKIFLSFLKNHNFSSKPIKRFENYEKILKEWNKKINLISKKSAKKIWTRHFLDSVLITKHLDFSNSTVIDLGSGGGLPGLPIKFLYPSLQLYLIESRRNKTLFLKYLIEKLDLTGCHVLRKRFENVNEIPNYSCNHVLVRAVKIKKNYINKAFHLLRDEGKIVLYRSMEQTDNILDDSAVAFEYDKTVIEDSELNYGGYKFLIIGKK
ncbi:MAG: 16S rRNA (guanine(527)-N(7))-methyltransferase RsmG [Candidatus Cloacimonetes bacterium]|nr:16S rRNA (guanine(527)-N(7))-methyltransferase RsmG [Candidatus Cloacimonadota bacterium]MBS3767482.1 16S rRNA (guanine(527)-N(7))-methyltransferase RsmG [Candidatus Cloacimonadota bacterium]